MAAAGPEDLTVFEDTQYDAPDTPAHLFAVKAFKQALFGTPKPVERSMPRRKKAATVDAKGAQPANTKQYAAMISSPSKPNGILLTPGTGGARRKTVSFGNALAGNMNAGPEDAGGKTPRDFPGGFPSVEITQNDNLGGFAEAGLVKRTLFPIATTKPDQAATAQGDVLERVSNNIGSNVATKPLDDATIDLSAPRSTSGRYWKREFDDFSSRSTLELRKMAKKEQIAKKYAKHKDKETVQLHEQLRTEQKRILQLEREVQDYVSKLQAAMQSESTTSKQGKHPHANGAADLHSVNSALSASEDKLAAQIKKSKALQISLTQSESRNREMEKTIAALKRENETLRAGRPATKPTAKAASAVPELLSSDIWADLAVQHGRSTAAGPQYTKNDRSPLVSRHGNTASQPQKLAGEQKFKVVPIHTKSQDHVEVSVDRQQRLEAAKRRLAMKKSQRARDIGTIDG